MIEILAGAFRFGGMWNVARTQALGGGGEKECVVHTVYACA